MLKKVVNIFENDKVVARGYRGPLYLSRHGLYIDPKIDRKGYRSLQEIQIEMDGKSSNFEIAERLGITYDFVDNFARELISRGLAEVAE